MRVINHIQEMRQFVKDAQKTGKIIGFVPTMGALHEGHATLMRRAHHKSDVAIVSIFLNPIQFSDPGDLKRYPKTLKKDIHLAQSCHIDAIFCPLLKEIYPKDFSTYVVEEHLSLPLCGKSRPGHFHGVTTIIAKLFNIIEPDIAFFGQKDAQQAMIIQKIVQDLSWDIQIEVLPTVRDFDGLPLSSRNVLLSLKERDEARVLNEALFMAKIMITSGERSPVKVKNKISRMIQIQSKAKIDYVEIIHAETLEKLRSLKGKILVALAVSFGKVRLIDNLKLEV